MSSATQTQPKKAREFSEDASFGKAYDARLLRRLFDYIAPYRSLFLWSLISYPIASALHLVQPYIVKVAVDQHFIPRVSEGFG